MNFSIYKKFESRIFVVKNDVDFIFGCFACSNRIIFIVELSTKCSKFLQLIFAEMIFIEFPLLLRFFTF